MNKKKNLVLIAAILFLILMSLLIGLLCSSQKTSISSPIESVSTHNELINSYTYYDDGTKGPESHLTSIDTSYSEDATLINSYIELQNIDCNCDDLIVTKGYYFENDGGGAKYIISDSYDSNWPLSFALPNGMYANLVLDENCFNIKQLGAYGDGIHDDTEIIKKAVNLLNKNLKLYFPDGTYLISQDIEIYNKDDITLFGSGCNLTSSSSNIIKFIECSNISLRNLSFSNLDRLKFDSCGNIQVNSCAFVNMDYYGILITNPCDTAPSYSISNCSFSGTGSSGIFLNTMNHGSAANDIRIVKCNAKTIQIIGNEMTGTVGHSPIFIQSISGYYADELLIEDNLIHDIYFRGIELWDFCPSFGYIRNNTIYNCGINNPNHSGVGCNGIYTKHGAPNISVENNLIYNVCENGIEGTFKKISDNTIHDTGVDFNNHPTPSTEGIYGQTPIIEANVLYNISGFAIGNGTLEYNITYDIRISNNTISSKSNPQSAIHYWGGVTTDSFVFLKNNTITGYSSEVYTGLNSPQYYYEK